MAAVTTMVVAGLTAAGTAFQTFGAMDAANAQKNMTALEMQAEAQRRKAMELDARRRTMEIIRQQQRARATSLTVANAQGAQFGSGLGGAYGQIGGQTGINLLGTSQNLEIGRNIFDINSQISQQRMAMADAQSMMAFGQGLQSLGGSFLQGMPAFGRLTGGFGMGGNYVYGGVRPGGYY